MALLQVTTINCLGMRRSLNASQIHLPFHILGQARTWEQGAELPVTDETVKNLLSGIN